MSKRYNFIAINNIINLEFINSLYKKINSYSIDDFLIMFKLYKDELSAELDKLKISKVRNIQDIFNLDDPNKLKIKQLMINILEESIESILMPCLNSSFLNSNIKIEGCGTFIYNKTLFIVSSETSYGIYSKKTKSSFLFLDLINKFLL